MAILNKEELLDMNFKTGVKIGITSRCFDLLHYYHIIYLRKCKSLCNFLIVLVDSDLLIRINKNKATIQEENQRVFTLNETRSADAVCIMNNLTDLKEIAAGCAEHSVTYIFKNTLTIYNTNLVRVKGVENIIIPDVTPLCSTTDIINQIRQNLH